MIVLEEEHFIAAGAYCECYQHPENALQCVKIPTDNKKSKKRLKGDLSYYKKLHKRGVRLDFIADYIGKEVSNMGVCYLYECIKDADGSVSKTLEYYLQNGVLDKQLIYVKVQQVGRYLLTNRILISDMHARNILIRRGEDEEIVPMIVDGIGENVAIPILNVFGSEVDKKISRRWNRFVCRELDGQAQI